MEEVFSGWDARNERLTMVKGEERDTEGEIEFSDGMSRLKVKVW